MNNAAAPLTMSPGQRESLTRLARSATAAPRQVQRAKVLMLAADGMANSKISANVGVTTVTVRAWRTRFEDEGLATLGQVREGRGRKPAISDRKRREIVRMTMHERPSGATHWSCRSMANAVGVSPATVQRIWSSLGLKPHLAEAFKLSDYVVFEAKLIDVAGLYLSPPEKAVVLCLDERTSAQAMDHSHASSPTRRGRAGRPTSGSKGRGTSMLFAALQSVNASVIASCPDRHRDDEFLKFIRAVETKVPKSLAVHLILSSDGTHKHPEVKAWLAQHPRFHLHPSPHSAFWLNLVDRWFRDLTNKAMRQGTFHSAPALIAAIESYMVVNPDEPKPLIWTATAESILAKSLPGRLTLRQVNDQWIDETHHQSLTC
jgi:transposase